MGAAADVVWQHVQRRDTSRVSVAGYATSSDFAAFAPGPLAGARLRLPLAAQKTWLEATVRVELLFPEIDGVPAPAPGVWGAIGGGVAF